MLCSYSICSVYKNNGNIQNAINIITYVLKILKGRICQAASNNNLYEETQALQYLAFETRSLPQNQRSFTTDNWSFSVYTIYRCINIHDPCNQKQGKFP